jgi:hypothetical protein
MSKHPMNDFGRCAATRRLVNRKSLSLLASWIGAQSHDGYISPRHLP